MRVRSRVGIVACVLAGACALDRTGRFDGAADGGSSASPQGGATPAAGGAGGDDAHGGGGNGGGQGGGGQGGLGGGGAAPTDQQCPPGEFVTGFEAGVLQCAPIQPAAFAAVNDHCSLYLGWRDNCNGCTDPPTQWGHVAAASCTDGAGDDNSCITATLGATDVRLFGLSPAGTVDGNDKFHTALRCATVVEATPVAGPACPTGTFASAVSGMNVTCVTALDALTTYVRSSCEGYFGWRDACNGCTDEPSKWGTFGDGACDVGTGSDCTCATHTLDESVALFGLNTDLSVNDDDKFYVGLQCSGAVPSGGVHADTCATGELVVGVRANGMVECASPAPAAEEAIQAGCFLYFGWRDACDDCTDPPAKWGRVSHALCENGEGADNTCTTPTLAATTLPLFGLNTDGGVNDDDKFYVGLKCE